MVKQHDILADLHVHTLSSDGGLSTLHEMLCGGRRSGMRYIAVTDIAQTCTQRHINQLSTLSSETGIKVIPGVEYMDVLSVTNSRSAAYMIMGIHPTETICSTICTANSYFEMWLNAVQGSGIRAIAHLHKHLPYLLDETELVAFYSLAISFLRDADIWLEISPCDSQQEKRALSILLSLLEKERGINIVIGSGAKYCEEVGRFHDVLELFNTFDINQKRVVNTNEATLSMLYTNTHPVASSDN